ncbi:MAG: Dabb family protein [Cyclobacteriaceae bacterium]|nr:Dabb family protein [Cyclobacteriaceae bacterium]
MKSTRRKFLTATAAVMSSTAIGSFAAPAEKRMLVHHVFFWLKNPGSKADLAKLLEGINSLKKIDTLRQVRIGVPAATTKRDVIDDSYSVSLLTVFDNVKGHDIYQDHPIHTKFVETYSNLWNKVVVYDSMDL